MFRAVDGLWEEHRVEDVATPEGFARNPGWCRHFIMPAVALQQPEITHRRIWR